MCKVLKCFISYRNFSPANSHTMPSQNYTDAVTAIRVLEAVQESSKAEIIACLSTMPESDLQSLIIAVLSQSDSLLSLKSAIQSKLKDSLNSLNDLATNLYSHFSAAMPSIGRTSNGNNRRNQLLTLPSEFGALVLSFCDAKSHRVCQLPMSMSSLSASTRSL